jgi:integrase
MNLKLPIRPETQKIMDKYMSDKSEFIFGVLKGNETTTQLKERSKAYVKRINRVLKAICKKHNISKHVTTYTARHTAANQLLAGDVPVAKISQLLGHKDIKTTQNYLSRLPDYNIQKEVMKVAM